MTTKNGIELINRLRKESFNIATEKKLESHPYVAAAEAGSLTLAQQRAFVTEQYHIQKSDATSFALLAGHANFTPHSLSSATVPEPVSKESNEEKQHPDLFQFILGGEVYAAPLLLRYATALGISDETSLRDGTKNNLSPIAQAYPSYWARIALGGNRAAGAAACAVNFPAWGRACGRLHAALVTREEYGYGSNNEEALDFISFFASPIDNLDEMAAAVIDNVEGGVKYEDLIGPVRLLQEYEVMFWDAIFEASNADGTKFVAYRKRVCW